MHEQFVEFWEPITSDTGKYFDIANIHSIDTDGRREDLLVLKFKKFLEKHGVKKPIRITEAQFGSLGFEWEVKKKLSEEDTNELVVRVEVVDQKYVENFEKDAGGIVYLRLLQILDREQCYIRALGRWKAIPVRGR
jgi:hypothetical protein